MNRIQISDASSNTMPSDLVSLRSGEKFANRTLLNN